MKADTITAKELSELCSTGTDSQLIDVRTPAEYREVHVKFARNLPLDRLDPQAVAKTHEGAEDEPIYVICQSGTRGEMACKKFREAGFTNVINVEGGTKACLQTDLPVVHGKKTISLERQVRIAAGSLVLLGAVLGWLVHPSFIGLSGFVGAGLVFAGVTDTCGMGMMLAKMPWNRCVNNASCKV